jgi:hypothetical protein
MVRCLDPDAFFSVSIIATTATVVISLSVVAYGSMCCAALQICDLMIALNVLVLRFLILSTLVAFGWAVRMGSAETDSIDDMR